MSITELLGVENAIIQAPMAGVQNWQLAVAVAQAGGLGSIPCGMLTPEQICEEIEQFKQHSDKPFNLNFFCHQVPEVSDTQIKTWVDSLQPYYQEAGLTPEYSANASRMPFSHAVADAIEQYQPKIMSFHFGLPEPDLLERIKGWGCVVLSSATTVAEGLWLEANGADVIIAQGNEAGGHRGMFLSDDLSTQVSTHELVSALATTVSIPVIAAGGISDAEDIRAVLKLGAQGVQLGTTYLLCDEAKTSAVHRKMLLAHEVPTAVTNLFSGRPARGIKNRVMTELGEISSAALPFPFATQAIAPLRTFAEAKNLPDFTPLWSGCNRKGCKAISATVLTEQLLAGFKD